MPKCNGLHAKAENDFNRELNRENIAFLNSDKALLDRIQPGVICRLAEQRL
jgi:hypothetical protein